MPSKILPGEWLFAYSFDLSTPVRLGDIFEWLDRDREGWRLPNTARTPAPPRLPSSPRSGKMEGGLSGIG